MKMGRSMRRYLLRFLLVITSITALTYTVLMIYYLYAGVVGEAFYDLELAGAMYARDYEKDPRTPLPQGWLLKSYLGVENLPAHVLKEFPAGTHELGGRMYHEPDWEDEEGDYILFLPYSLHDGKTLYLVKTYGAETDELAGYPRLELLFLISFPIGVAVVLIIFLAVRYMLKRLYQPVKRLNQWAGELSPTGLAAPLPDFEFSEVNELARQLHGNLSDLGHALEREQRFLRNASHELRTPVAVIQSNLELLDRLNPEVPPREQPVRERLHRAGTAMGHLIETLLWLAMDEARIPDKESVALDELCREIIRDNRYLLADKPGVAVCVDTEASQIHAVPHGVRMAVANLVRNAFQYTQEGQVTITVSRATVQVENVNQNGEMVDETGSDYGVGIGLTLVAQIAQKAGWDYENQAIFGGRLARLCFDAADPEEDPLI